MLFFVRILLIFAVWTLPTAMLGSEREARSDGGVRLELYAAMSLSPPSIKDPHPMPCGDCHLEGGGVGKVGALRCGEDTIALCRGCHPATSLHPVGIPADAKAERTVEPALPLGRGSLKGKITCLTCHYRHGGEFRRHLLRGDSETGGGRRDRLCEQCHSLRQRRASPHAAGDSSCCPCHTSQPRSVGDTPLREHDPQLLTICYCCHPDRTVEHTVAVNPFADANVAGTAVKSVPLLNGRLTCVSCHDQHGLTKERRKLLRKVYLDIAAFSSIVNPHWKDFMCPSCHEGVPKKGDPKLAYGGDLDFLCGHCHSGNESCRGIHPVNVVPSPYVTIPPHMPLKEGKINCVTCHDSSLQEVGERVKFDRNPNPNFLRGESAYRSRFCMQCHPPERHSKYNVHDQIDSFGVTKELSCLFCHSTWPRPGQREIQYTLSDDESLNDLCAMCHQGYEERHPEANHLVEPSYRVRKSIEKAPDKSGLLFPLYGRKILCITCHNPHRDGVIRDDGAYLGFSKSGARQLVVKGMETCEACHAW